MSTLLHVGQDRDRAIDLLAKVMQELAFSKITPAQRAGTMQHFAAMKHQPANMDLTVALQTGENGQTRITIDCKFHQGPAT